MKVCKNIFLLSLFFGASSAHDAKEHNEARVPAKHVRNKEGRHEATDTMARNEQVSRKQIKVISS